MMLLPETELFQRFRVLRQDDGGQWVLGRSRLGVTYRAVDTTLDLPVALRVVEARLLGHERTRERFLHAVRTLAGLRHRHVARVHHLGHDEQHFFYATEFIDGETIEEFVARHGAQPWRFALSLALQATQALLTAHERQLTHGSLTATSVLLADEVGEDESVVKIVGFDLSGWWHAENNTGSHDSHPAGPERATGLAPGIRSDIHGLGALLWHLLAGAPFSGGRPGREAGRPSPHTSSRHRLPAAVPGSVRTLLTRLLDVEYAQRFQSAGEVARALKLCWRQLPSVNVQTPRRHFGSDEDGDDEFEEFSDQSPIPPRAHFSRRTPHHAPGKHPPVVREPEARDEMVFLPEGKEPPVPPPDTTPVGGSTVSNLADFAPVVADDRLKASAPPAAADAKISAVPTVATAPKGEKLWSDPTLASSAAEKKGWAAVWLVVPLVLCLGALWGWFVSGSPLPSFLRASPEALPTPFAATPRPEMTPVPTPPRQPSPTLAPAMPKPVPGETPVPPFPSPTPTVVEAPALTDADQARNAACERFLIQARERAALGFWNDVVTACSQVLDVQPQWLEALCLRGEAYAIISEPSKATEDYSRAVQEPMVEARDRLQLCIAYAFLGQSDKAREEFEKSTGFVPVSSQDFRLRGRAYATETMHAAALKDFDEAVHLSPGYADALRAQGDVYVTIKDDKAAIASYTKALAINPQYTLGLRNRGLAYLRLHNDPLALKDFDAAIQFESGNPLFFDDRGALFLSEKRYTPAVKDFSEAIRLNPNFVPSYEHRASAYRAMGNTEAAKRDESTAKAKATR